MAAMQAPPNATGSRGWSPTGWRSLSAAQQPDWPDQAAADDVLAQVAKLPPLVFAGEARTLQAALANVAAGHGFLLQAGDCAESFEAFSANAIDRALRFMTACGIEVSGTPALHQVDFYTSHEALVLGFEQAMTREDSLTGGWYDTSAHLLWIGERTRQLDGAHVEFLAGVGNPIGLKLGPTSTPDQVVALCERLDPQRVPGRLILISRMGSMNVERVLPSLISAVAAAGHPVVWECDPMHGNTFVGASGHKTRRFDDVMAELRGFFAVHRGLGTHPGGIHIELTGEDVTECLGGAHEIEDGHLSLRYETACDPRLNASQSLELAFQVAELLRG